MMTIMITTTITAGILVRGELRRLLFTQNIEFTEDKGWLDSCFKVKVTPDQLAKIRKAIAKYEN